MRVAVTSSINSVSIDIWSIIVPMLGEVDQTRLAYSSKAHYLLVEAAITYDPDEGMEKRYQACKLSYLMAKDFLSFIKLKEPKALGVCLTQTTQVIAKSGLTREQLRTIGQTTRSFALFPLYQALHIEPDQTPKNKAMSPLPSPLPNASLVREIRNLSDMQSLDIYSEIRKFPFLSFFNERRGSFTKVHQLVRSVSKTVKPYVQVELSGRARLLQRRSPPSSAAPSPRHGAPN